MPKWLPIRQQINPLRLTRRGITYHHPPPDVVGSINLMRTLISVRADFFLIHSHVDPGKSTSLEDIPVPEEVSNSNVFVGKTSRGNQQQLNKSSWNFRFPFGTTTTVWLTKNGKLNVILLGRPDKNELLLPKTSPQKFFASSLLRRIKQMTKEWKSRKIVFRTPQEVRKYFGTPTIYTFLLSLIISSSFRVKFKAYPKGLVKYLSWNPFPFYDMKLSAPEIRKGFVHSIVNSDFANYSVECCLASMPIAMPSYNGMWCGVIGWKGGGEAKV